MLYCLENKNKEIFSTCEVQIPFSMNIFNLQLAESEDAEPRCGEQVYLLFCSVNSYLLTLEL